MRCDALSSNHPSIVDTQRVSILYSDSEVLHVVGIMLQSLSVDGMTLRDTKRKKRSDSERKKNITNPTTGLSPFTGCRILTSWMLEIPLTAQQAPDSLSTLRWRKRARTAENGICRTRFGARLVRVLSLFFLAFIFCPVSTSTQSQLPETAALKESQLQFALK